MQITLSAVVTPRPANSPKAVLSAPPAVSKADATDPLAIAGVVAERHCGRVLCLEGVMTSRLCCQCRRVAEPRIDPVLCCRCRWCC